MNILRSCEKDIIGLLKSFPAVGIIGPRQVGKTTLAKKIIKNHYPDAIYLDLERNSSYNKLNDPELYLENNSKRCVVIDEIQRKPELFPLLRSLIDEDRRKGRFIILGSASPELLKQSSESLAGRIAYQEIHPFSLDELPKKIKMEEHWFRGGFPDSLLAADQKESILWLNNFIKTYTERDLPLLGLERSPVLLFRFWVMMSNFCGRLVNYTDISNSLDISVNTVKRYMDIFEKAYLIRTITPYYKNISKRLVKSPKLIMSDTGIIHRLWDLNNIEDLYGNPMLGFSWENYCINQILIKSNSSYDVSYYRTHDGAECDLILSKSLKPEFAIEIKYSSTPNPTRMNTMAFQTIQARQNFIIIPRGDEYALNKTIKVCGIKYFLDNYL